MHMLILFTDLANCDILDSLVLNCVVKYVQPRKKYASGWLSTQKNQLSCVRSRLYFAWSWLRQNRPSNLIFLLIYALPLLPASFFSSLLCWKQVYAFTEMKKRLEKNFRPLYFKSCCTSFVHPFLSFIQFYHLRIIQFCLHASHSFALLFTLSY